MKKRKLIVFLFAFCLFGILNGQSNNQKIFLEAITDLYNESQKEKYKYEAQYKSSNETISKYANDEPKVSVFGGTTEQNQKIEEAVKEVITNAATSDDVPVFEDTEIESTPIVEDVPVFEDTEIESMPVVEDVPPPPPPAPPSEKKRKSEKQPYQPIDFSTSAMFPDEEKGLEIRSADHKAKSPQKQEKIEWVEGETIITTHKINIDDIKDPVERQRLKDYGAHHSNVVQLNRISFIESIYNDAQDNEKYTKMLAEFKKYGYDFDSHFQKMSILDKSDQVPFIKAKITEMVEKVVR